MRSRAVLPNVERRLISLAKKRAAEAKRRRRRGPGFAIIAFAGLALGGSALAATGVWNPLGGDGDRAGGPASPSGVTKVGAGFARGVPILPRDADGGRQRPDPGGGGRKAVSPPFQELEPVVDPDGEADTGQGAAPNVKEANDPFGIDDSKPEHPGKSDDGNGPGKDPPSQQGDEDEKPPVESPPTDPPRAPSSTRISVFCGFEGEGTIQCLATVSGEVGAPTGQVDFEDSRAGQSANSCALSDDGNGISSSCTVDFPVGGPLREVVARYGGDAANASSSTGFLV